MKRRRNTIVGIIAGTSLIAGLIGACAGSADGSEPVNTNPKLGWVLVFPNDNDDLEKRCDPTTPGIMHFRSGSGDNTARYAVNNVQQCL